MLHSRLRTHLLRVVLFCFCLVFLTIFIGYHRLVDDDPTQRSSLSSAAEPLNSPINSKQSLESSLSESTASLSKLITGSSSQKEEVKSPPESTTTTHASSTAVETTQSQTTLAVVVTTQAVSSVQAQNASDESTSPRPIDDGRCLMPQAHPDPSWVPTDFDPPNCDKKHAGDTVRVDRIGADQIFIRVYKYNGPVNCKYQNIQLKDDYHDEDGSLSGILEVGKNVPCPADVFRVTCIDTSGSVLLKSIERCTMKIDAEKRLEAAKKAEKSGPFDEQLNILLLGFDSMAHFAWQEQMPKTEKYTLNELGGVVFNSYNIVGDGTTNALLALMSGFRAEELHEARPSFEGATQIDDFPLLFLRIREHGYVTTLDEDGAGFGTFQYRFLGFKNQPADHYGRKFQLPLYNHNYPYGDKCLGAQSVFDEMMNQARHMFEIYPESLRKFALIFSSAYSHTWSGAGDQMAYKVDEAFTKQLKHLNDSGYLNETFLVIFSDHGSRYTKSRITERGKIGERLPYLAIVVPEWFRKKYPRHYANLQENTQRLITPYDVHATLNDVARLKPIPATPSRGISLFQEIPINRTCPDAGIDPHWCLCLDGSSGEVNLTSNDVQQAIKEFELYVNKQLLGERIECEIIRVDKIYSARRFGLRAEVAKYVESFDAHGRDHHWDESLIELTKKPMYMQASFTTQPGNGQWEVTFNYDRETLKPQVLPKQISRTNLYGSAPKCVTDRFPHLAPYCYCRDASL